jgi:hypothetical protein
MGVEAIASKLQSGGFVVVEDALSPVLRASLDERLQRKRGCSLHARRCGTGASSEPTTLASEAT